MGIASVVVVAALALVSQEITLDCASEAEAAALTASVCDLPTGKRLAFSTRWDDSNARHADMTEMLASHGFKGTYFLNGIDAKYEALVKARMLPHGAGIGNHTIHHDSLGLLLPNAVYREIMRQRIDEETKLSVAANVFTLPYSSCGSPVESTAERNTGDCLARAGLIGGPERYIGFSRLYGLSTNEWVDSFTFSINDADPDEKLFRDQFAKGQAMALKGQLPCGPSLTLGIHTWQKGEEGLAKLGRIIEKEARRPDVWYCTFNEYAAFRVTALNAEIRKSGVRGKTAVFAVRRPAAREVGAAVPLTLRFSNGVVRDFAPDDRLPTSIAFVPNAVRYDPAADTVTVRVGNDGPADWRDVAVTLRLPPSFAARTLTKTVARLAPGEATDVSFACGARRTDALHLEGDWYFAAEVDADGVRRWSDLDVRRPTAAMDCPRDRAQVVGPVFLEAITNLDLSILSQPGAALPSFGVSPRENVRRPGPFPGAAPYALSLYPSAKEMGPVVQWWRQEAKERPAAFLVAFDLMADVAAHGADARLAQNTWNVRDWQVWVNGTCLTDPLKPFQLKDGDNRVLVRIDCKSPYSFRQQFGVIYGRDGSPVKMK